VKGKMAAIDCFWENGPKPGSLYQFPGSHPQHGFGKQRTLHPITTGTSVLAVKFDGGVAIAADMLGSYGSLARYRDIPRVMKVNDCTVLGAGGDYADFQFLQSSIEQRVIDEECMDDGFGFTPRSLYSWLTRIMYNRRCKMNPIWNTVIVGGLQDGEPFLGYVDKIGTAYEAPTLASGFGSYIAQPMLRDAIEKNPNMSEEQALANIDRCLKVLFYRDARSYNKYQVAIVTKDGSRIVGPKSSETDWSIAHMVKGYE